MRPKHLFALVAAVLVAQSALAQAPPCRPCAGLRVVDPASVLSELQAEPALDDESRLYIAWSVQLDGSSTDEAGRVAEAGATPWITLLFRTPAPLTSNLEALDAELRQAVAVAAAAGERAHLQVEWQPDGERTSQPDPKELAFLIKRAAVAITGANTEARVISGALDPDPEFLNALWAEDISAYLDGVALRPAGEERLRAAVARLEQLDPGRPIILDALDLPEAPGEVLAAAAHYAAERFSVVLFAGDAPESRVRPLKLLAREFAGDLSLDPYSEPLGDLTGWAFVRGSDLGLRGHRSAERRRGRAAGDLPGRGASQPGAFRPRDRRATAPLRHPWDDRCAGLWKRAGASGAI